MQWRPAVANGNGWGICNELLAKSIFPPQGNSTNQEIGEIITSFGWLNLHVSINQFLPGTQATPEYSCFSSVPESEVQIPVLLSLPAPCPGSRWGCCCCCPRRAGRVPGRAGVGVRCSAAAVLPKSAPARKGPAALLWDAPELPCSGRRAGRCRCCALQGCCCSCRCLSLEAPV